MIWRVSWPYLRMHKSRLVGILLLQLLAAIGALLLPDLNAAVIDDGVVSGDVPTVWKLGGVMLAVSAIQGVAQGFAVYYSARMAMGLGAHLRSAIFDHIQDLSVREVHQLGAPSLITRSTNDIQQIQMVVLMIFTFIVTAPMMGIGGIFMALRTNVHLGWILAAIVPTIAAIVIFAWRLLNPLFLSQQQRLDGLNTVLREELSGIRVIRAFVRQKMFSTRYTDANTALKRIALRIGAVFALIFPLLSIVASFGSVAVIWFGSRLIDTGEMEIGQLFAYISYLAIIFGATMMASMMFFMLPRAEVTARRVQEVFSTAPSVTAPPANDLKEFPNGKLSFALKDATVQYPGAEEPVLKDISVELTPGTSTAIIGTTGSGKSTMASLFPRLMDPSGGAVLVNGIDVRDLDPETLRSHIGFVPQTAYLFSGTIASTVSGVDHPDAEQVERIERALRATASAEFVSKLDDRLEHEVEPGGKNFSGGQRQRLTMARALYRDADLYIFDDSFSALDYATDAEIRNSLRHYVGDAAILIVAQRVATIRHVDTILVIEDGRVVGRGTHRFLVENCPTYRQIVESQESGLEAT